MPESKPKFYLTTPIYYVNARPHIGHAYSTIAADVIARRHRLLGDDTFFLTGTDEHGQKVQRSAEAAGIPPQQFADEVSATFRNLWKRMGITNDDYIRTTDERHKRGVQHLWKVLEHRGAIYLSTYTGQYSVGEEMFVEGPPGTIGPDGKPTETVTEENYFFRLSDYQEKLINLIEGGELHIQPETTKNEVLSFLRGDWTHYENLDRWTADRSDSVRKQIEEYAAKDPNFNLRLSAQGHPYSRGTLKDLSISRTTFDWGIPVPGNPKHVIYVWLDALVNYITAVGYGSNDDDEIAKFNRYWPADLHLVGKEITRFHCVYWPAFLMAAGLALPKSVVANGWLLFEEAKMSKSRGNVVRTETILDAFGPLCPLVPVSLDGTGLQPGESEAKEEGALAPGTSLLTAPTKAQQDLFAADVLRYFLLREIPFGQDGSFSFDALITRYNADLANGYGNLVSRTLKMIEKYFDGYVPTMDEPIALKVAGWWKLLDEKNFKDGFTRSIVRDFEQYAFDRFLQGAATLISTVDQTLSHFAPWKDCGTSSDTKANQTSALYYAAEAIRIITILLHPVMPYSTLSVWRQLGLDPAQLTTSNQQLATVSWGGLKPGTKLGPLAPIFPRADKGLAQLMTNMESPTTPATAEPAHSSQPIAHGSSSTASPNQPAPIEATGAAPRTSNLEPRTSAVISIDDFTKIDLRVAQIVVAERIPKADKLLRLEVDLGTERRQILSGIAEFYTPEELIGKRIAIIANLAPRKMRGLESHGMLLAASGEDHSSKPILATFSDEVPLGSKIR